MHGSASDWDISASPIRQWVRQWSSVPIELIAVENVTKNLSSSDHRALLALSALESVTLHCSVGSILGGSSYSLLVEAELDDGLTIAWGISGRDKGFPDMLWGSIEEGDVLVSGYYPTSTITYPALEIADQPVSAHQIAKLDVTRELDGNCQGFGKRFLDALVKATNDGFLCGEAEIQKIVYSDRYINNPLSVALLVEFVSALKQTYPEKWGVEVVQLTVVPIASRNVSERPSFFVSDDWPTTDQRNDAIEAAFDYCGVTAEIECKQKNETQHARVLDILLSNTKVIRLSLDQGFSFWRTRRTVGGSNYTNRFDFRADISKQGEYVANMRADIEGAASGSYIVIEVIDNRRH